MKTQTFKHVGFIHHHQIRYWLWKGCVYMNLIKDDNSFLFMNHGIFPEHCTTRQTVFKSSHTTHFDNMRAYMSEQVGKTATHNWIMGFWEVLVTFGGPKHDMTKDDWSVSIKTWLLCIFKDDSSTYAHVSGLYKLLAMVLSDTGKSAVQQLWFIQNESGARLRAM